MDNQINSETSAHDPERHWRHPFNAKESVERVKMLEGKKLDAQVKCGLELLRAKINLKGKRPGEDKGWYAYLFKCGMTQPTAWRRMDLAKEYLSWGGISNRAKPEERDIFAGLEHANGKSFKLNDFRKSRIDMDKLRDSLQAEAKGMRVDTEPGVRLKRALKDAHYIYEKAMPGTKYRDALETLYLTVKNFRDQRVADETAAGLCREGRFEEVRFGPKKTRADFMPYEEEELVAVN